MPDSVRCIHGFAVTSESGYCTACLISELQRQLAAANKRADEADMNNRMQLAFRMKTERQLAAANERADKAEVEIERLKKRSEGHDKPCFDCGRRTNDLSGDPGQWGIPLCHSDHPGVVQWHHAGCVSNRLAERDALKDRLDALPGKIDEMLRTRGEPTGGWLRMDYVRGQIRSLVAGAEGKP